MSAKDYDDTDMTAEEFEEAMAHAVPADVANLGGSAAEPRIRDFVTGSSAVTRSQELRFAGSRDQTITEHLELAGT